MSFNEWKEYSFDELIDIIGGGTPKTTVEEYWNGHIPWLSVKDFNTDNRTVYETEKTITELGLQKSSTKLLNKGDLIISARGTVGALAQLGRQMAFNQSCYGLRANSKTTNDFLYYLLKYKLRSIQSNTHGSVFSTITKDTFKILKAIIPIDIEEQKAISKILSDLDKKIETNNKINKKLEEMAQAIFKQWFVDFEFPNENGEPYKSSGGEMVESELGMIPSGWKVELLKSYCDVKKGLSYKGKHLVEDGTPMINLGNVNPGGGFRRDKCKFYDGDFKEQHTVKAGDIIIANTDMTQERVILGSPIFVPDFKTESIIFTHHLFAFRNLKIPKSFLYYYLKSKSFRERAESYATGTTVLAISRDSVLNINFVKANNEVLNNFDLITKSILDRIENNNLEIEKLQKLRDELLPKLMSGEIRINNVNI